MAEKIIEIKGNTLRLVDRKPFLLPDKLTFKVKAQGYDISNAFICMQNGSEKAMYVLTNPFTVPEKLLFAGALNISIKLYHNGECIKTFYGLPIILKEADFGIYAFDQLNDIEKRLSVIEKNYTKKDDFVEISKAHNTLAENHNKLAETVKALKEKIKEI